MKKYAIIVAGGKGVRMGSAIPKQFLVLGGKPLLMHTVDAFKHADSSIELILVLPSDQTDHWKSLVAEYNFDTFHTVVEGGETRFDSVKNGLGHIPSDGVVAIHDGVRPLVPKSVIVASFEYANHHGNAIASVRLKESIREMTNEGNRSVDRENYRLIQTPQTFQVSLIKRAYDSATSNDFTDDAGVLEKTGKKIHLIDGHYGNIKVTTPEDLVFAETMLGK
ncbi:MAG: 2-C-methyl-D-erythritol 4-phosphate cytidylyltransferase [Cyclobacteriaceae bacterium]